MLCERKKASPQASDRVIWRENGQEHTGIIESDPEYRNGLKVCGRALMNIVDSAEYVRVIYET